LFDSKWWFSSIEINVLISVIKLYFHYLIIFIDCDPAMAFRNGGQLHPDVAAFGAAEEALGVDDGEDAAVDAGPLDNDDGSVIHSSYL